MNSWVQAALILIGLFVFMAIAAVLLRFLVSS